MALAGPARAEGVAGTWEGDYVCGQGRTGLTLLVGPGAGTQRALFVFYPVADNPDVPEGCFEMTGRFDPDTGEASFAAGAWVLQPEGYVTVDLLGTADKAVASIGGTVDGPGCEEFELHRVAAASRPLPEGCRHVPDLSAALGG
jgi:hypothetical protein